MGPTHCQVQKTALAAPISQHSPCLFNKAECSVFCILSCELGKDAAFLLSLLCGAIWWDYTVSVFKWNLETIWSNPSRKSSPRKIKQITRFLLPASHAAHSSLFALYLPITLLWEVSQAELFEKFIWTLQTCSGLPRGFGSVPYVLRVSQRADFRIRRGWCNLRAACGDQTLTRKPPNRTTASSVTRARICSAAITSGGTICQVQCWTQKGCVIASGV